MSVTIRPRAGRQIRLQPAADKSLAHRAFLLGGVARGRSHVRGRIEAGDVLRSRALMQALGVGIESPAQDAVAESYVIHGEGLGGLRAPSGAIDCGRSGTTLRLAAGLVAAAGLGVELDAEAQLRARPMQRVLVPLQAMGAKVTSAAGHAPLRFEGGHELVGIEFDNQLGSAQVKGALLLAGLGAVGTTRVREARASRRHTERMLAAMGAPVQDQDGVVAVDGPFDALLPFDVELPGDPSSAAPWLVLGTLDPGATLALEDVLVAPERLGLVRALQRMGGQLLVTEQRRVFGEPVGELRARGSTLRGLDLGAADVPAMIDELPLLGLAMCLAEGPSELWGAEELRTKESDRIRSTVRTLQAFGAEIEERPSGWRCRGSARLRGTELDPGDDHRIVMLACIAAALAEGPSRVHGTGCLGDSYAGFLRDLAAAGIDVDPGVDAAT